MKKVIFFLAVLIMLLMVYAPVAASVSATVAGNYYYTDIKTYLWNTPINSINIGGMTLIDAESMSHYGFTVELHDNERWLEIVNVNGTILPEAANGSFLNTKFGKPGIAAGKYYHSDIKITLDGRQIASYKADGKTFISAEAMKDFGYDVIWNDNLRTLSITMDYLRPSWEWVFTDGTGTTLNNGFSYEVSNSTKSEDVEFSLVEATGEYNSVGRLVFNDKSVTLSIYMNVTAYGDFWDLITSNRNIIYGEREHEDTFERRVELSRVFRVFANDTELEGEMAYAQGNGHSDYTFILDKALFLEEIKTLRLEVGYKQ
jgi:hypothetical protein